MSTPPKLVAETYITSLSGGLVEYGYTFKEPGSDDVAFDMRLGTMSEATPDIAEKIEDAWRAYRPYAEVVSRL